jgi:anthranilate synthase/aminodeoxychorismate synthase-like glutamine amidotransferase
LKILLIDHNDSFTYNIVDAFRQIQNCEIIVVNYSDVSLDLVSKFDKIILSPGPGLPKYFSKTLQIIEQFYKTKPILGICLGHQAICQFFDAQLNQKAQVVHGDRQLVTLITKDELHQNLPNIFNVGLYHSWYVNQADFPKELTITSISETNMIMSISHKNYPIFGVQYHPESFLSEFGTQIFKNFASI